LYFFYIERKMTQIRIKLIDDLIKKENKNARSLDLGSRFVYENIFCDF
jgi:hypothetical protein